MTAAQDSRAQFEDGAWYWVEKEGWIGDPPTIAPACYKAECDAWNSFAFSGIPTREVKVLEPCRRAALSAEPVAVPQGWQLVPVEPTEAMLRAGWDAAGPRTAWPRMLAAAPQPAAQERKPLTDAQIEKLREKTFRHVQPVLPMRQQDDE